MSDSNPIAVLFDIDGTLADSNFLHVDAWNSAFTDLGLSVPSWRIQRAIGADGSELLAQLIDGQGGRRTPPTMVNTEAGYHSPIDAPAVSLSRRRRLRVSNSDCAHYTQ